MKVAVVGAGPAGLACAVAFERHGADVVLVDRRADPTTAGAGIGLWWNGLAALRRLGVLRQLLNGRHVVTRAVYRNLNGDVLMRFEPDEFFPEWPAPFVAVRRAELQHLLATALHTTTARFGIACDRVEQDANSASLTLSDGSVVRADLVVAADGMQSRIRGALQPAARVVTHSYAWTGVATRTRSLTGACEPAAGTFEHVAGRHGGAFFASMRDSEVFWGVIGPRQVMVEDAPHLDAVTRFLAGWWPRLTSLVEATTETDIVGFPVRDLRGRKLAAAGRVAVVGDAAHGMVPHLAQGVSQCLEDAVALAAETARGDGIAEALRRYRSQRARRGAAVAAASRYYARTFAIQDPVLRLAGTGRNGRWARGLILCGARHLFGNGTVDDDHGGRQCA
jgi:2-polyprenyl-6-methoxyphenol hydroxylase-like FAD-dependent oxidoreductase